MDRLTHIALPKSAGLALGCILATLSAIACAQDKPSPEKQSPASPPTNTASTSVSSQNGPAVSEQRIRTLIGQLGDKDYATRQYAQDQLAKLGFEAYEALSAATTHEDPEIAARARYLLRRIRLKSATEHDPPEVRELLRGYDIQDQKERIRRLQELGRQPGGAGIPALCRLVKIEKSSVVSNWAGLEVLNYEATDKAAQERLARIVRENLVASKRPAAKWLLAYAKLQDDPKGGVAEWARLIEGECAAAQGTTDQYQLAIVAGLLYRLAEVCAKQGDSAQAEKIAGRALRIGPGSNPDALQAHLTTAWSLKRRGLFKWAEGEFRRVADAGLPTATVIASNALAEMFHDQGNHQAAAETLRTAIEAFNQKNLRSEAVAGRQRHEIVARMHYFHACHFTEQGDKASHLKHLEEALKSDPTETDALIAYYRASETPEQRKKAERLVGKAVSLMREQIADEPDDPNAYNQFAWLVGNTKGNLDEALKFSKLSLELSPNNGAYLDTLAHVHFARGELEEAVACQTKAVESDPHSGLIVKELEKFRAALAAKKKGAAPKAS